MIAFASHWFDHVFPLSLRDSKVIPAGLRKHSGSGEFDLVLPISHHNSHICLWVPGMDWML